MPTRNVVLSDHQSELVERQVASGRYQNASEVLREGLRLIERRDEEESIKLAALREAIRLGVEDLEAGRYDAVDVNEIDDYVASLGHSSSPSRFRKHDKLGE
ncbi:MAG: type II toxin-antitoxin system ParD family antitoxin [Ancrocorticia sp.]